jgi:hypothetical protein
MSCACTSGNMGAQVCTANGEGYGACECAPGGPGGADGGVAGTGAAGTTGAAGSTNAGSAGIGTAGMGTAGTTGMAGMGAAGAQSAGGGTGQSVQVTVDFPNLFTLNNSKVLPTYISHVITSTRFPLAKIAVKNTGVAAANVAIQIDLPNFGSPATQMVALGVAETKTVTMSPLINYMQLFQNTAAVPAGITVGVSAGSTSLFSQTYPIQITGRNTVFWTNTMPGDFVPAIATMVTPQDKGLAVQGLLRGAANRFPGKTPSLPGYQLVSWPSASFDLAAGFYQDEAFVLLPGESPSVKVTQVAGGVDDNFAVYIMDDANFTNFDMGQPFSVCAMSATTPSTGVTLSCPTPGNGLFHIVYLNPNNNLLSRTVTRTRPMLKWEVTYYQTGAIFEELRSRGLVYVNLSGSGFFAAAQNVRYPVESITGMGANCIDGSLLFASAFEAAGMEPILAVSLSAGHAIVGVRCWAGDSCVVPIDTTYVGTTKTFDDGFIAGSKYWQAWSAADGHFVDIKASRAAGITPAPM